MIFDMPARLQGRLHGRAGQGRLQGIEKHTSSSFSSFLHVSLLCMLQAAAEVATELQKMHDETELEKQHMSQQLEGERQLMLQQLSAEKQLMLQQLDREKQRIAELVDDKLADKDEELANTEADCEEQIYDACADAQRWVPAFAFECRAFAHTMSRSLQHQYPLKHVGTANFKIVSFHTLKCLACCV